MGSRSSADGVEFDTKWIESDSMWIRASLRVVGEGTVIEMLKPWRAVSGREGRQLEAELHREIPATHALAGKAMCAFARRDDCDDVLFEIEGGGVAVVHLSWSRETSAAWPRAELYVSIQEWAQQRMKPDSEELAGQGS